MDDSSVVKQIKLTTITLLLFLMDYNFLLQAQKNAVCPPTGAKHCDNVALSCQVCTLVAIPFIMA